MQSIVTIWVIATSAAQSTWLLTLLTINASIAKFTYKQKLNLKTRRTNQPRRRS